MQDRYVADIGDFGKHGMLRWLFGFPEGSCDGGPRLGVAWYLNAGEGEEVKPDGRFTSYLWSPRAIHRRLRACDEHLSKKLKRLLQAGSRNVFSVQQSEILPSSTRFHRIPIPDGSRDAWFEGALRDTNGTDVVFVDPDNGIVPEGAANSPKHVSVEELQAFFRRKQSLIIYHHLGRNGTAEKQISEVSERLMIGLGLSCPPWVLWYHRGTARVYFIIPQPQGDHWPILEQKLTAFRSYSCWFECQPGFPHPHFEVMSPT